MTSLWECRACTFENPPSTNRCEICHWKRCHKQSDSSSEKNKKEICLTAKWGRNNIKLKISPKLELSALKTDLTNRTGLVSKKMTITGLWSPHTTPAEYDTLEDLGVRCGQEFIISGEDTSKRDSNASDINAISTRFAEMQMNVVVDDLDYIYDGEGDERPWTDPKNKAKLYHTVTHVQIPFINPPRKGFNLLVLDLDYTLVDLRHHLPNLPLLLRPYAKEFLETVYTKYDICIWSQTNWQWLDFKLVDLGLSTSTHFRLCFVADKTSMFRIRMREPDGSLQKHHVKPLAFIWEKFPRWQPHNTLHVDDLTRNFALNPRNGITITPFRDAKHPEKDTELFSLARYLLSVAKEKDLSKIDHSTWRLA